jgi:hypothetical protein
MAKLISWLPSIQNCNKKDNPTKIAMYGNLCRICLSTLICYPWAYSITLTQLYPPYFLAQILEFWVICGVEMMWLCHGWDWQPPQTASHIHIRHIQSDWAHWYTVHTCTWLQPYTVISTLHLGSDFGVLGHLWSHNKWVLCPNRQVASIRLKRVIRIHLNWFCRLNKILSLVLGIVLIPT